MKGKIPKSDKVLQTHLLQGKKITHLHSIRLTKLIRLLRPIVQMYESTQKTKLILKIVLKITAINPVTEKYHYSLLTDLYPGVMFVMRNNTVNELPGSDVRYAKQHSEGATRE
jgi:hypothetical protein